MDVQLVESAKINFIGFGSDVTNMLRPEFFKDVSGSKAKFDGPSVLYNLKYNTSNGFMYMERPRDVFYPEVMYIVGTGVGFPREPYVATLAWDFAYPHQWFFFKRSVQVPLMQSFTLTKLWDLSSIGDMVGRKRRTRRIYIRLSLLT